MSAAGSQWPGSAAAFTHRRTVTHAIDAPFAVPAYLVDMVAKPPVPRSTR